MSNNDEKVIALIRQAMAEDEKIDELEAQVLETKKKRAAILTQILDLGEKSFTYKDKVLTIFSKGGGLLSLRGKNEKRKTNLKID